MWRRQKMNARSSSLGNSHTELARGNSVLYKSPSPPKAVRHSPIVQDQQIGHGVLKRMEFGVPETAGMCVSTQSRGWRELN